MSNTIYIFIIVVLLSSFAYATTDENHLLLAQIDKLSATDLPQSKKLLLTLNVDNLSKSDKELYDFLSAYFIATSGQLEGAISSLQLLTTDNIEPNIKTRAYSLMLLIYAGRYDWESGLKILSKLSNQIVNTSDKTLKSNAYTGIIQFYNHVGEHQLAKKIAAKALLDIPSPRNKCVIGSQLLHAEFKISPNLLTKDNFTEVIRTCEKVQFVLDKFGVYYSYAEYLTNSQNYEEAEKILYDNLDELKSTGYQTLVASYHSQLARIYQNKDEEEKAEYFANRIIDAEEKHQNAESVASAYQILTFIKERQKAYKKALHYYQKYIEANQRIYEQNNAKLLAIQKAEFDAIEQSTKIALLDKENALLKTQALLDSESAQSKRLALALLSMVLIVFVLWTYKNRRNYLKMQHFAQIDELTGIANRRHFTQQASNTIKYCQTTNQPVSFIIFDLDFFKRINDKYGHQKGDLALKIAVQAAKSACRKNDIIGRLGGEEFGILLPGCASHLATFIAEKCRKAIRQADFSPCSESLVVTASFGIADSATCGYSFEKLFAGADSALYQSKDMGRNRVVQFQQEMINAEV